MKVSIAPQGFWIKANEDVVSGDTVSILDSGEVIESKFGKQTVFQVKTKKGERNMGFNKTTMNNMVRAFGDDTEKWVNQLAKVFIEKAIIGGERKTVIYLAGIDWEMDEETGNFYKKGSVSEDDIPFPTN